MWNAAFHWLWLLCPVLACCLSPSNRALVSPPSSYRGWHKIVQGSLTSFALLHLILIVWMVRSKDGFQFWGAHRTSGNVSKHRDLTVKEVKAKRLTRYPGPWTVSQTHLIITSLKENSTNPTWPLPVSLLDLGLSSCTSDSTFHPLFLRINTPRKVAQLCPWQSRLETSTAYTAP